MTVPAPTDGPDYKRVRALADAIGYFLWPYSADATGDIKECPFCGSTNTVLESPFGPTLCRSIYYCQDCRNPIERFRSPGE